jgi:hypothetical protein
VVGRLYDFFIAIVTDGCSHQVRFQALWAVCEFIFHFDLALLAELGVEPVPLLELLLRFGLEQGDLDANLACVVAWSLRGVRMRFILAGREEEFAAVWDTCGIGEFVAQCEELEDPTLSAEIARIETVASESFLSLAHDVLKLC